MRIGDHEILVLYALLDSRQKGEFLPLTIIRQQTGLPSADAKSVALRLENSGIIECSVDDRLAEDAKYKYRLTPSGVAFMQEVLRVQPKKGIIHKPRRPE